MKPSYNGRPIPSEGEAIQYAEGKFSIPDRPIIPFIEGDGTGRDIWKASERVFDAAVNLAYGGKRKIAWFEVFAGEKAFNEFKQWLPSETVDAIRDFRVAIKGPLTTPVGGGIRSLNVALRQLLDLYACVRPVRYFQGVASPVKHPERLNVVIFRENTEDVYIGIEWKSGTPEVKKLIEFLNKEMLSGGPKQIRTDSGVAIKPISPFGTKRLVRRAIEYALANKKRVVTIMHKGNIQKFTEGAFRDWGYELAVEEFRSQIVTERESWIIDNCDRNPQITVEQNAASIEPGLEQATEAFRKSVQDEVKSVIDKIYATHGQGQWKNKLLINDRIARPQPCFPGRSTGSSARSPKRSPKREPSPAEGFDRSLASERRPAGCVYKRARARSIYGLWGLAPRSGPRASPQPGWPLGPPPPNRAR